MSRLFVVGIGPGDLKHMTYEARDAIESAEVVVGYTTYLKLIEALLQGKEVSSSGMTKEVERCREALRLAAEGKTVALVSSGDAGIYGMAGLVLELVEAHDRAGADPRVFPHAGEHMGSLLQDIDIIIIPGISALQAAASVLGAPLMHDFAVISLSDLLTPWDMIEKRLEAAATADFVVALYNPRSKGRIRQIERAREIMLAARSPRTPVGIVRNACRPGEEKIIATLGDLPIERIDMFSLVMIGNSATFVDRQGRMVTPRGYKSGSKFKVQGSEKNKDNIEHRTLNIEQHHGKAVMFCGTASDVGKSVLAAGFCRILSKRGISVAPFKSQNMALNSFATPEGGEIGRAQAVQAQACRIPTHTDMNPILLKPNSDTGSQVIVQGKVVGNMSVAEYNSYKPTAFIKVEESFDRLQSSFDFVVIEGAGSIAEINLKEHDIANLRVAEMAGCPCILVADIDRGGVFAQIVGTMELLEPPEKARIKGVIINKFRGDPSLLKPGIDFVEQRTGVPVLGVVPWFSHFRIPEEDSVALEKRAKGKGQKAKGDKINIGVVRLPRISNYTDFDPLEAEPDVDLHYIEGGHEVDGLDILILPGSKSTTGDLLFLMRHGFPQAIRSFTGPVVGICGGYQMLGRKVSDPHGIESHIREADGLGLLDVETVMRPHKETHQAEGKLLLAGSLVAPGCIGPLFGYEIHMGRSTLGPEARPFIQLSRRSGSDVAISDGAVSPDGRVFGTYLHGLFDNHGFRAAFLNRVRQTKGLPTAAPNCPLPDPYDLLAEHLERHLDMERLFRICGINELS
jgi:adenosylcobyric acid synthase